MLFILFYFFEKYYWSEINHLSHCWGIPSLVSKKLKTLNTETDIVAPKFLFLCSRESWSAHLFLP